MRLSVLFLSLFLLVASHARAAGFHITVLGARGGLEDGNLSAYLVRPEGDPHGVLCDAGTVLNGIEAADRAGAFSDLRAPLSTQDTRAGFILHDVIRAYLISHAHLDHVAGLVLVSPDDAHKPIYALPSVHGILNRNLFGSPVWINMTDEGTEPRLGMYHDVDLNVGTPVSVPDTTLRVTAWPLSHGGMESTAFLIGSGSDAMLYLGDTGADSIEHGTHLHALWQAVAPLVRMHRLRGIIIECSYDNARPEKLLFGHLTPRLLLEELRDLQRTAHASLRGLPVLVAHIKPSLRAGADPVKVISDELRAGNDTGVQFTVAEQGMTLLWR
ncbi:MBL fold metallo-hydrolase [Acetobacter oeni]|uniref:3',5'-cyclic-nucleotide phosphodiesterase n=1 Tax=Acetobacter oeni TaxID=304077 RepID=A0A511XLZ3_9PROT|nr:3',5'-cyclic-nucleotide phosphodiesterase [Acetobacter oeni]MBB3882930.1 3',5'-cyclic-nucleotide phosphodiesterase [Acetobacter oeni]NHO19012.1 3',5'-cyclic-nucleotide phosphodiesterase [Acetobacter oeni]GBR04821.1 cyclic-AMP phosphodiesterase [Acetobacter oeni LMG 21952]GEN63948.1 3',5'-cyclic-nucleotide phosphodiesterase [Acetobacter oeni]